MTDNQSLAATITITYCTGCKWLLRAAWMAQELLSTFENDLHEVALRPGSGGIFVILTGDGVVIWDRKHDGGFHVHTSKLGVVGGRLRRYYPPTNNQRSRSQISIRAPA